jgi:short-subunit dehydrogenase
VLGVALPPMTARDRGHIVITGSLSGFRGLPGAIGYAAAKAGTMVLAESLYADLRKTGVTVQLANPGFIRTRLTAKNDFTMPFIMEPEAAAEIMFRHMQSGGFKISFPTVFSWLFRGGNFLPDALYYRLFAEIARRQGVGDSALAPALTMRPRDRSDGASLTAPPPSPDRRWRSRTRTQPCLTITWRTTV